MRQSYRAPTTGSVQSPDRNVTGRAGLTGSFDAYRATTWVNWLLVPSIVLFLTAMMYGSESVGAWILSITLLFTVVVVITAFGTGMRMGREAEMLAARRA